MPGNDLARQIKERLTTRQVVELYGFHPDRGGYIQCPFHTGDNHGSLKVYDGSKTGWHSFGCGAGGSVIDFVMRLFGLSFAQACLKLNCDFGLGLTGERPSMAERSALLEARRREAQEKEAAAALYREKTAEYRQLWEAQKFLSPDIVGYIHPLYAEAAKKLPVLEWWLDQNTAAASAAQFTYNSALLASPVTWVVMMLAVLVAALYAGVAAYNKFTGAGVSATGILVGALAVLGAFALNSTIVPMHNGFAMFANFLGNLFNDPVAAVKVLFYDMALTVLGYITNMASGIETLINKIPGVTVDLTSGLDSFYAKLESAQKKVKDEAGWVEYVKKMDYIDYSKAAGAGYRFGEGLADKVAGVFSGSDYAGLGDIAGGVSDIAANTGKIADEVHIADEDLQFFRDVAEMRYIQNFVQLTPTVSMSASISEKVDVNGVIQKIEQVLKEEIAESAEVVLA